MAQKVAAADGAWSAAATWNSVTNTPTLHASTNVAIDGTARFTAGFTAPSVTDSCTGVLLYITNVGSGGTVAVTLQESTVDTAAARTINITDLVDETWVYFTFATPYTFTTTGAGAYRFKIQATTPAGTTNAAADSGGSLYAYLATDDRTGVPGITDDIWICGLNQATAITVTMDGTQTIGSKTDTVLAIQRTLGNAISLNNLGVLSWDTVADATLTCGGNIICNNNGGELQIGTVATPMPAARVATLRFDMAATGNHGLRVFATGKLILQGTPKSSTTLWKAKLSSGVGTAADPAIMDAAVDWSVGDEVVIGSTDTYDHTEYRFIITKNSPTSYVWSATSGGAEAALAFTHTSDAWVLNIQRNVILDSTNAARAFYALNDCAVAGNVNIDWILANICGSSVTSKNGFYITNQLNVEGTCDYSVISNYHAGWIMQLSRQSITSTGLIAVKQTGTGLGGIHFQNTPHNKTLVDCYVMGGKRVGISINTPFNVRCTRCFAIACNGDNDGGASGWSLVATGSIVLVDCESHCNRRSGFQVSGAVDVLSTNYQSGNKGDNLVDVAVVTSGSYNTVIFVEPIVQSSGALITGYLTMLVGSSIQFHGYNGDLNNHTWYKTAGAARSTGAGLVDTTNKTAGNFTVRIAPEDATLGFIWEFLVGIKANTAASIFGFAQKNAAFGTDVVTIELFLPGSTTADATATLDNTTGAWQVFNLAANYTGSVAAFATIRVTAKTVTAAAYVYFTDFYNGTNVLTGLQAWHKGNPTPVMTDLLGDPASVWAILASTQTTPGTMGYTLVQNLDASVADVEADTQNIQSRLPAALVGGRIDASVGAMATDTLTAAALAADAVAEIQAGLSTLTPAQVNAEVVDALAVDTYVEPVAVPAATASLAAKIGWLMALARNKILQTATTQTLRNDGDSGNVATAPVSDDGVTATRGKWS